MRQRLWQRMDLGGLGHSSRMSDADKARNKAQEVQGKVKEKAGQAVDDPYLEAEGKTDQAAGSLKQAGEKVKDALP